MKLLQTSQAMPHFPIAGRSRIRCLSQRIIAAFLGAASSCLIEPQTWAQGKEVMYSLDLSANARILTIDPQSGAIIRSTLLSPTIVTQTGLAWDGNRLLIKGNTNWLMDRLVVCHPADGYTNHLGAIGAQWYLIGVDFDPTTSTVRVLVADQNTFTDFYAGTIDQVTGALALGPKVTGASNPIAIAIDSIGRVIMVQGSAQKFFSLDLTTGAATLIGSTGVGNSLCWDLSYDANDQLWGAFEDVLNGANSGIYRIDLGTLTANRLSPLPAAYVGLAFGRDTLTQNYCVAKTSSLSCSPTLRADGIASPAARFGFTVHAENLNNNRVGMLLYSSSGRAAIPFQGGLLCVSPPAGRSPTAMTGGTPSPALDCSGAWSIDWNDFIWSRFAGPHVSASNTSSPAVVLPGTIIDCQWWGRDPGFPAPNNSMLSDGLEFTTSP